MALKRAYQVEKNSYLYNVKNFMGCDIQTQRSHCDIWDYRSNG